ncbi:MAG: hypothetical protein KGO96_07195 [Elusimicrobia bacterium]|nr:hypothetical protein [Elusimicrobiota bacterium]
MLNPQLQTFTNIFKAKFAPKLQIKYKDQSLLMKIFGFLSKPFNPSFMTDFITTMGNTIYFPRNYDFTDIEGTLDVLSHEFIHVLDYNKNPIFFSLSYILPQILAIVPLLLIIFFPKLWFLFLLLTILFASPLPAYFRMKSELRGYTMSLATYYWLGYTITADLTNWVANEFTDSSYYFMWPFNNDIQRRVFNSQVDIRDKTILKDSAFNSVYQTWIASKLIKIDY